MAATERLPHPDDAEFAEIRADLSRLFMRHKRDLAMDDWPDEGIIEHSNNICAALIALANTAREQGDTAWLLRHRWFFAACGRLFDDERRRAARRVSVSY